MVSWFEETGIEINGFKTLEEALLGMFQDEEITLELYKRLKKVTKRHIEN